MLLEIHVQAVRKKMSQMLVFRFQAVMRSEIKVAKVMMSHCQEKLDRKSTRLNSSHLNESRMPSSA